MTTCYICADIQLTEIDFYRKGFHKYCDYYDVLFEFCDEEKQWYCKRCFSIWHSVEGNYYDGDIVTCFSGRETNVSFSS